MPNTSKSLRGMYSEKLSLMIRDVLHALGDVDFEHQVDIDRIEQTVDNKELKEYLIIKAKAEHQIHRQPYVDLLNKLWLQQHRRSFAA
jgi:hypothetical protein